MQDAVMPHDVEEPPRVVAGPDLAALLDRAVAGDVGAAAAVYDQVSTSAYRLVVLIVGDLEIATEVCARAFDEMWQVWRSAPNRVHRTATARTWLLTMMHRYATDQVRSMRRDVPQDVTPSPRPWQRKPGPPPRVA